MLIEELNYTISPTSIVLAGSGSLPVPSTV
jgi:hypothetical protein